MRTNLYTKLIVLMLSLVFSSSVFADFNKALDAYIARDGALLLNEIKKANLQQNYLGMMSFLIATDIDAQNSDYDEKIKQYQSTLREILTPVMWKELTQQLMMAAKQHSIDAQFYLLTSSQFRKGHLANIIEEYVNKGSKLALKRAINDERKKAELGSPQAQFFLGLKYFNFTDSLGLGCSASNEAICKKKNPKQGIYWLKKAAVSIDESVTAPIGIFADSMCDLFQKEPSFNDSESLRQAFLWCLMGVNSGGESSMRSLQKMYESGKLKLAAPKLNAIWLDNVKRLETLNLKEITEFPEWVKRLRQAQKAKDLPVFSYYFSDPRPYAIEVYRDGRIFFNNNITADLSHKDFVFLKKVTSSHVREFFQELRKTGFFQWPLSQWSDGIGFCEMHCETISMQVITRSDKKVRRFVVSESSNRKQLNTLTIHTIRMAKTKAVVDHFFSMKPMFLGLGNSDKVKQDLTNAESYWQNLSTEDY